MPHYSWIRSIREDLHFLSFKISDASCLNSDTDKTKVHSYHSMFSSFSLSFQRSKGNRGRNVNSENVPPLSQTRAFCYVLHLYRQTRLQTLGTNTVTIILIISSPVKSSVLAYKKIFRSAFSVCRVSRSVRADIGKSPFCNRVNRGFRPSHKGGESRDRSP